MEPFVGTLSNLPHRFLWLFHVTFRLRKNPKGEKKAGPQKLSSPVFFYLCPRNNMRPLRGKSKSSSSSSSLLFVGTACGGIVCLLLLGWLNANRWNGLELPQPEQNPAVLPPFVTRSPPLSSLSSSEHTMSGKGQKLGVNRSSSETRFCQDTWDHEKCREERYAELLRRSNEGNEAPWQHIDKDLQSIRQCRVLGPSFTRYVSHYIARHYLHDTQAEEDRVLMYSCESHRKGRFCGGMGDRFRGMISLFWMALLSDRRFELYHPKPAPIQAFLPPNWINYLPSIPSRRRRGPQTQDDPTISESELEEFLETVPVSQHMMRIKGHAKFLHELAGADQRKLRTFRAQSNSVGVDSFFSKGPSAASAKWRSVKLEEMGLPASCNISCYFGCLHALLFRPSEALERAALDTMLPRSTITAVDSGSASPSSIIMSHRQLDETNQMKETKRFVALPPFVGVQVRMGGTWAAGLRIPEAVRTPPAAIPHFFSMIREVLTSSSSSGRRCGDQSLPNSSPLLLFVSSDSERFLNVTRAEFGDAVVRVVEGDAFQHTDTTHLGHIKPEKYRDGTAEAARQSYFLVLLNHFLLSRSSHMVMAQSGFGDTAFWRARRSASCLFVDMSNLWVGWQHRLEYPASSGSSGVEEAVSATVVHASPAIVTRSRILDLRQEPTSFC